uniref:Ubiquitin-like domain-containing protein n=1 Tax=Steinernema glaseri TaxID=37863 RepID=A0A1I7XWB5_9BILA
MFAIFRYPSSTGCHLIFYVSSYTPPPQTPLQYTFQIVSQRRAATHDGGSGGPRGESSARRWCVNVESESPPPLPLGPNAGRCGAAADHRLSLLIMMPAGEIDQLLSPLCASAMALLNIVHVFRYFASTQLYTLFIGLIIACVFAFAWKATSRRPLHYYGWLVRLNTYSNRRYVDFFQIMPITPEQHTFESSNTYEDHEHHHRHDSHRNLPLTSTTTVVIQTPATIRTEANQLPEDNDEMAYHQLELPPEGENDETELVHRLVAERTNNRAIATAVVMALAHNREQEQHFEAPVETSQRIILSQDRSSSVEDVFLHLGNRSESVDTESTQTSEADSGSDSDGDSSSTDTSTGETESDGGIEAIVLRPSLPPRTSNAHSHTRMPATSSASSLVTSHSVMADSMERENSATPRALSTIRLKFLDDTQRQVRTWLSTTVGDFKKNFFTESVDSGRVVRLIYQGQLLRDDARSLQSYGLHDDCVVHCHVGSVPYAQPNPSATEEAPPTAESMVNEPSPSFAAILSTGSMILRPILTPFLYLLTALFHVLEPHLHRFMAIPSVQYLWNIVFLAYQRTHNFLLGPPEEAGEVDEVAAASDRAANTMRIPFFRPEAYLGTLFTVKIAFLWSFVVFYPQYTDREAIILLLLVTVFFVSYIRCSNNRTRARPATS